MPLMNVVLYRPLQYPPPSRHNPSCSNQHIFPRAANAPRSRGTNPRCLPFNSRGYPRRAPSTAARRAELLLLATLLTVARLLLLSNLAPIARTLRRWSLPARCLSMKSTSCAAKPTPICKFLSALPSFSSLHS